MSKKDLLFDEETPDPLSNYIERMQDPELSPEARADLLKRYGDAVADALPDDPPLTEPVELHGRRVLIKGVVDGSVSAIKQLLTDHLGLLLGDPAPVRLNVMSGAIEHAGTAYDANDLVMRLRLAAEEKICFETRKLDEQGRPIRAKLRIEHENTKGVLLHVARANQYHPVQEWLESLKPVPNGAIELAAKEALGLSHPLDLLMWRKWLIGCVARAYDPGCQLDTVLVLVAPNGGERKSSMFRALVGTPWFSDTHLDMVGFKRENSYMQLHRVWVYEVPELEDCKTTEERSRTKSFISSRSDDYRTPYDAEVRAHPRSTALGATTNSLKFLSGGLDPAFDRRFYPIRVTKKIDDAMIANLRDEIWAEARDAYQSGEAWYILDNQHAEVLMLAERYSTLSEEEDAWTPAITKWISNDGRKDNALRLCDVMQGALRIEMSKLNQGDQKRVARVLLTVGWASAFRRWRVNEKPSTRWYDALTHPTGTVDPIDSDTVNGEYSK